MREELLSNLYDAYDYLYICDEYTELIKDFERDTESCKQMYLRIKNENVSTFHIYLMIFFATVMLLIIGGLIAGMTNNYFIVFLIIAGAIFALFGANRYSRKMKKEPEKKATEFWNSIGSQTCVENDEKISKIRAELDNFCEKNDKCVEFLPVDYRDDRAVVSYMIHTIENGMADSIKEALNLYMEQKHRWEMEAAMRGMANAMENHNREMEAYMSEISQQQRVTNSRLADIEMLTFLDYINK